MNIDDSSVTEKIVQALGKHMEWQQTGRSVEPGWGEVAVSAYLPTERGQVMWAAAERLKQLEKENAYLRDKIGILSIAAKIENIRQQP